MKKSILVGLLLAAAVALVLSGCASMDIASAVGKQLAPQPAPAQPAQQPAPQAQPAPAQSQAAGPAIAYQYQFNAFYSGFWSLGWFGYKDGNYKAGQGTIWLFTTKGGKNQEPVTFERALLKANPDSSQWWRFKVDSGKNTILYEFLVSADGTVQKVRYKDPDSGAVQEFVPSSGGPQPSQQANVPSRQEFAKYKVDSQTIKVQAGSFATDHYLYTDPQSGATVESWVSTTVPGSMVKSIYTSKKKDQTSNGELIQIESGVTTTLGSY